MTGKGKIYSRQIDLSKESEIEETFEWIDSEFGGPYILINNAGYLPVGSITGKFIFSSHIIYFFSFSHCISHVEWKAVGT